MSRIYTISFAGVSVAAQQDLFSIKPATDKPIKIHSCVISNVGVAADAGDAAEELLRVAIVRGNTTIGSGGSNPTARPVNVADTAFGPTTNVRANDTTKVSGGTGIVIYDDGFNVRVGWQYVPVPEDRISCTAADGFIAIQLLSTPTDAILMSGTLIVEELP
ncbi:MAG: hypothetical protein A2V88_12305 [Elusimicrobia bacterium RBG_16_66_12]|nr:MAG: hypothetical protein A2V88_12305 [Elusimicrobia bacterium RBG_16_66_12]